MMQHNLPINYYLPVGNSCQHKDLDIPEKYIELVMDMYHNCMTTVRSEARVSSQFEVKVGLHQGSALSPFLF